MLKIVENVVWGFCWHNLNENKLYYICINFCGSTSNGFQIPRLGDFSPELMLLLNESIVPILCIQLTIQCYKENYIWYFSDDFIGYNSFKLHTINPHWLLHLQHPWNVINSGWSGLRSPARDQQWPKSLVYKMTCGKRTKSVTFYYRSNNTQTYKPIISC